MKSQRYIRRNKLNHSTESLVRETVMKEHKLIVIDGVVYNKKELGRLMRDARNCGCGQCLDCVDARKVRLS